MALGGYYVATHILTVWKHLAGLEPDQPHGWSFPDVVIVATLKLKKIKRWVYRWLLRVMVVAKTY